MEQYSEKELDQKIHAFMDRKTHQYPELMKTKKAKWTVVHPRIAAPRFSAWHRLKPQLLG